METSRKVSFVRLLLWTLAVLFLFAAAARFLCGQLTAPNLKIDAAMAEIAADNYVRDSRFAESVIGKISYAEYADIALFKSLRNLCQAGDFGAAKKLLGRFKSRIRAELADAYLNAKLFAKKKEGRGLSLDKCTPMSMFVFNLVMYANAQQNSSARAPYYWDSLVGAAKALPYSELEWLSELVSFEFNAAGLGPRLVDFWEAAMPGRYDLSFAGVENMMRNVDKLPEYPKKEILGNNVYRLYRRYLTAFDKSSCKGIDKEISRVKRVDENAYRRGMVQLIEKVGRLYLSAGNAAGAVSMVNELLIPMRFANSEYKSTYAFQKVYPQCARILALCGEYGRALDTMYFTQDPDMRFEIVAAVALSMAERGDREGAVRLLEDSSKPGERFKIYFDLFK